MNRPIRPGEWDEDRMERSRRVEWIDVDRLRESKALVIGAGALGNEVSKNLALSGVGDITIVDMDRVSLSNLNRCLFFREEDAQLRSFKAEALAERVRGMGAPCKVKGIVSEVESLDEGVFKSSDVVLGCLDNIAARLHVNAHCCHHGRPLIDGGTLSTSGKVQVVIPRNWPCLQCSMNRTHFRTMEKRYSCTGSDTVFFEPKLAAEITTTSVIAAIQVRESIKVLCSQKDKCLHHLLYYNGLTNQIQELEVPMDPECPMHSDQRDEGSTSHHYHVD
ncbi:MAG: ThiF family adenylyltransferase [Methanomassiliicoccales archaeon]|nr:ThiF family adenylyltransferase [Methanomassiliicoccales archaeon]